MFLTLPLSALVLACGGCSADNPDADPVDQLSSVCAHPSGVGEIGWGDANHDARLDLADASRTLRHLLDEGAATACLPAMDISYKDDLVDIGDALAPLYVLFVGNSTLPGGSPDCDSVEPLEEAPCGRLRLSLDGPASAGADKPGAELRIPVSVRLESPDLSPEGWSFGLVAEGCTFASATETGSVSADLRLDPAGRRDQGWLRTDLAADRLVSSVLLSWADPVVLPAQAEAWTLLQLELGATAPSSGCEVCSVRFEEGVQGEGLPVATMLSVNGRSLPLTGTGVEIEVCVP